MWIRCKNPLNQLVAFQKYSKSPWILQTSGYSDTPFKKPKLAPLQERRMIDRRRLRAKGVDGGNGCFSFHRSRHMRHGRSDGGNGGRGGDVILECSPTIWDLSSLQPHMNAKRGGHGASKNKIGSRGDDKVVLVPVGTVLHLVEGEMPTIVEKGSSAPLNPWEIPPTLETGHKEMNISKVSSNKGRKSMSSVDLEYFDSSNDEKISSWEAQGTGNGISESNKMEEFEQEE